MIAYASRTGNVEYIVNQLDLPNIKISKDLFLNEPFILFTYTDLLGAVPKVVKAFMQNNSDKCMAVIASGNTNFGFDNYAAAGDKIARQYNIPLITKLDLRGNEKDYELIKRYYEVMEWK